MDKKSITGEEPKFNVSKDVKARSLPVLTEREISYLSHMGDVSVFGVDALYEQLKSKGLIAG